MKVRPVFRLVAGLSLQFNQNYELPPTLILLHMSHVALKSLSELSAAEFNLLRLSILGNQGDIIAFACAIIDVHGLVTPRNFNNTT